MWDSSRYVCSSEQLIAKKRKQRKNHTNKLHELALLLPQAPKTGSKKLTKKEILLHVLHYIQYLQRNIDVAKALLTFHITNGEGGLGGLGWNPAVGPAKRRHSTPPSSPHSAKSCLQGACQKPQKKKLTRGSGCYYTKSTQDDGPYPAFEAQKGAERIPFITRTQPCPRQKLVFYDSNEENQESPDADPWLPAWTPESSPHGSPLALGPPQIADWSETGLPSEILGLSPSLFSSPGKFLPEKILEDGAEYLTQALFEEAFLDPVSSPSACMLEVPQKDAQTEPKDPQSSSKEDGDYTTTPVWRASNLPAAWRMKRKGWADRCPTKPKKKTAPCPTQMKKKCVNGFIMFCRMNRKQYIRSCPGTASTAATKALAHLWRTMTEQERKPYCIKARRFSCRNNRIVKQENSSSEEEDWGTPKPFYQLMAEKKKARCSSKLASLPPCRK